jgi:hypothetical protein
MTFDPIILLALAVISGGVALVYTARLSRQKNEELRRREIDWKTAAVKGPSDLGEYTKGLYFGSQPKLVEKIGRFLVVAVIVFVLGSLLLIGVAIAIASAI